MWRGQLHQCILYMVLNYMIARYSEGGAKKSLQIYIDRTLENFKRFILAEVSEVPWFHTN